jgi:hypothetical protein
MLSLVFTHPADFKHEWDKLIKRCRDKESDPKREIIQPNYSGDYLWIGDGGGVETIFTQKNPYRNLLL